MLEKEDDEAGDVAGRLGSHGLVVMKRATRQIFLTQAKGGQHGGYGNNGGAAMAVSAMMGRAREKRGERVSEAVSSIWRALGSLSRASTQAGEWEVARARAHASASCSASDWQEEEDDPAPGVLGRQAGPQVSSLSPPLSVFF